MSDVDVTEIEELQATKVSGVGKPANGIPFILIKAAAESEDCTTCKGKGTIMEGNRECPDCKGSGVAKSDSDEADKQEDEMTGEAIKAMIEQWDALDKALSTADREKMPASSFAYIDKNGGKHLPIHDEGHTKSAKGRVAQQDFSEAKGDADDAKSKAEGKIAAAAKKFGIGGDAKKGAVQDGLHGNATPEIGGHLDTGKSGVSGSVTQGSASPEGDGSLQLGGQSTAEIPVEEKVKSNSRPVTTDGAGIVDPQAMGLAKAVAVSTLFEALDQIEQGRAAAKAFSPASGDAALVPGSMPWESYDAANLRQIAETLAECCNALDYMSQREREESMSADPGDIEHAWDLEEAANALDFAMGVAARLSFTEGVESDTATKSADELVAKVGRKLSGKNTSVLTAARDHLNEVLEGAEKTAGSSGDDDKETIDMASVTKDELGEIVVKAVKAVKEQEADEAAAAAKKAAEEEAEKNANNGGDIAEGDIKPTSTHDAADVTAVGGSVDSEYKNTAKGESDESGEDGAAADTGAMKAVMGELGEIRKGFARLDSIEETVNKIAKRARPVGPSLDGQARGSSTLSEGRLGTAEKSGTSGEQIEELEKAFESETNEMKKSQIGEELTHARLVNFYAGQVR